MPDSPIHDVLRALDGAPDEETWTAVAFIAGQGVELDEDQQNAALRRAELLLASGGALYRPLELYGRAASAVAADLDRRDAREQLAAGLRDLQRESAGLASVEEAVRVLLADPDLAWQCYAAALLAEALAAEDSSGSGA